MDPITIMAITSALVAALQARAAMQQRKAAEQQATMQRQAAAEVERRNAFNQKAMKRKTARNADRMRVKAAGMGMQAGGDTVMDNFAEITETGEVNAYWAGRDSEFKARALNFEAGQTSYAAKEKVTGALLNLGVKVGGAAYAANADVKTPDTAGNEGVA